VEDDGSCYRSFGGGVRSFVNSCHLFLIGEFLVDRCGFSMNPQRVMVFFIITNISLRCGGFTVADTPVPFREVTQSAVPRRKLAGFSLGTVRMSREFKPGE
jgi:hypothetical protein